MRVKGQGVLGVAMIGAFSMGAWADTVKCDRINSVPRTISSPGVYCLDRHLTTGIASGNAITIASDDVTLDLGGFTLAGAAGPATTAIGIHATGQRSITIRDGTVRGFKEGIALEGGGDNLVERIRAVENFHRGIGVVGGARNIVRQSQVLQTLGPPPNSIEASPSVLAVGGDGSRALDNDVFGFPGRDGLPSVGIAAGGTGVLVEGNRIGNPSASNNFGIFVDPGSVALVIDNRITTVDTAVEGSGASLTCLRNVFVGVGGSDCGP